MKSMQLAVGITYAFLPAVLLPFYARIIYIFLSKRKYRELDCYRIMIQIGILQCSMAPCMFLVGLTHILDRDPFLLASNGMKIVSAAVRMEALLSFVLALDRLRIICGLRYPRVFHTILVIATWIFGILYVTALMTPYAGYTVVPGQFLSTYDDSKPYSQVVRGVGTYVILITSSLTFLVYLVIIIHLVRLHLQATRNHAFDREKAILIYALVRFLADLTLSLLYNYATSDAPHSDLHNVLCYAGYILNNLLVSTVLYLAIYTRLRKEFVPCRNHSVHAVTVDRTTRIERA